MCDNFISVSEKQRFEFFDMFINGCRMYVFASGCVFIFWAIAFFHSDIFADLAEVYGPMFDIGNAVAIDANIYWEWWSLLFGILCVFLTVQRFFISQWINTVLLGFITLTYWFMAKGFLTAFFDPAIQMTTGIAYTPLALIGFAQFLISIRKIKASEELEKMKNGENRNV